MQLTLVKKLQEMALQFDGSGGGLTLTEIISLYRTSKFLFPEIRILF